MSVDLGAVNACPEEAETSMNLSIGSKLVHGIWPQLLSAKVIAMLKATAKRRVMKFMVCLFMRGSMNGKAEWKEAVFVKIRTDLK